MKAQYYQYHLRFKRPAGTSRGVLNEKETWFIVVQHQGKNGIGECGLFRGLSYDDRPDYEQKLQWVCDHITLGLDDLLQELKDFPSIQFGLEMAFLSLKAENVFEILPSDFTQSNDVIPINGLIWMGDSDYMKAQIEEKIKQNFKCIKLKIGAIDFDQEFELLRFIRDYFNPNQIEIRVDANGGFESINALDKLNKLSELQIHSIEQPIAKNQHDSMSYLCKNTPIPIALDEELIGVVDYDQKQQLLAHLKPQYIILKPTLVGGIKGSLEWIEIAEKNNIGWWITSALESNIGLNAIAQFTYTLKSKLPQGLGTGALFENNFESPLVVENGFLKYDSNKKWIFNLNDISSNFVQ